MLLRLEGPLTWRDYVKSFARQTERRRPAASSSQNERSRVRVDHHLHLPKIQTRHKMPPPPSITPYLSKHTAPTSIPSSPSLLPHSQETRSLSLSLPSLPASISLSTSSTPSLSPTLPFTHPHSFALRYLCSSDSEVNHRVFSVRMRCLLHPTLLPSLRRGAYIPGEEGRLSTSNRISPYSHAISNRPLAKHIPLEPLPIPTHAYPFSRLA